MAKFSLNGYWEPTPKGIRKAADAVISACTFAGGSIVLNGNPKVGTAIFIAGVISKMVSNFFTEEPKP